MPWFNIPELKASLPILQECYGFDLDEIFSELTHIIVVQHNEKRFDNDLAKQFTNEEGNINAVSYAINTNDDFGIRTTEDFDAQIKQIIDLCSQHIEEPDLLEQVVFVLVFMSAIFNRDINGLHLDEEMESMRLDYLHSTYIVRPDLLRLFIALNKPEHKYNTPMKICFKTDSPHLIQNKDGWFSDMLNDYIKQKLGDITIEEAEEELDFFYSDAKGRKSDNPYLNYIINGTYNFINHFMPSDKVTVPQCKFLLEYLKIIGQAKDDDINLLQSMVKSLISSKHTPVQKHVKRKNMRTLPLYQRVVLD
jgi:hypothetical protein